MQIVYILIATGISAAAFIYLPHIVAPFWIRQNRDLLDKPLVLERDGDMDKARRDLIERVLYSSGAGLGTLLAAVISIASFWLLLRA